MLCELAGGASSRNGVFGSFRGHDFTFPNRFAKKTGAPCRCVPFGKGTTMKTFINMLRDQSGASAAEYALILAIVGTGIAVAAIALGGSISTAMNAAGTCVSSQGKTCP